MSETQNYKVGNRLELEIIYRALNYVVRTEGIEVDEKHFEMENALSLWTESTDIPDILDKIYEHLLSSEDIREEILSTREDDKEKEDEQHSAGSLSEGLEQNELAAFIEKQKKEMNLYIDSIKEELNNFIETKCNEFETHILKKSKK